MLFQRLIWAALALTLFAAAACNEPTLVGAELFEEDKLGIYSSDTTTLFITTEREDSLKVFNGKSVNQITHYQLGRYQDPIFGEVRSDLYLQLRPQTTNPNFKSTAVLDSVVLGLKYDTLNTYGDVYAAQTYQVYRVTEDMYYDSSYYSNRSFATEAAPWATATVVPAIRDSVSFKVDSLTKKYAPQMRIVLPNAVGEELLRLDSAAYASPDNFVKLFKGIKVAAGDLNSRMLGINVGSDQTAITLFYRDSATATVQKTFKVYITGFSPTVSHFQHNYMGSTVEPFINVTALGDSLAFIQSVGGLLTKVTFPHVNTTPNTVINNATLEFTLAVLPADDTLKYPFLEQVVALRKNTQGQVVLLQDVVTASNRGALTSQFGGNVTRETVGNEVVYKYKMNITAHYQGILAGTYTPVLYIGAFPASEQSRRVVMYGAKHSRYPAKLKLVYTKI